MRSALTLSIILAAVALTGQAQAQSGERFRAADLDADGRLSAREFQASREEAFVRLDANADGRIAFSELRALAGDRERAAPRRRGGGREALKRLREIDRNGDRAIDLAEFRALGQRRFQKADTNRDGWIEPAELQRIGDEWLNR